VFNKIIKEKLKQKKKKKIIRKLVVSDLSLSVDVPFEISNLAIVKKYKVYADCVVFEFDTMCNADTFYFQNKRYSGRMWKMNLMDVYDFTDPVFLNKALVPVKQLFNENYFFFFFNVVIRSYV